MCDERADAAAQLGKQFGPGPLFSPLPMRVRQLGCGRTNESVRPAPQHRTDRLTAAPQWETADRIGAEQRRQAGGQSVPLGEGATGA